MLEEEIKKLIARPMWVIFLLSWLFYLTGLVLFSHFVWSDDIYGFSNNKTGKDFESYIDFVRRIDNVRYFLSPIFIATLAVITWLLLQIGFHGTGQSIQGKKLFKIVCIGILILSLPLWIKSVYFVLIVGEYTPDQVKYFYPLSISYFFRPEELSIKVVKALGRINLFQLGFMAFIAWCIRIYANSSFGRLFAIVLYTYGLGFILLQMIIILIFM